MSPPPPSAQRQRHGVFEGAVPLEDLRRVFPCIRNAFEPQVVKYANTNPKIAKSDGEHGESVEWKVSCYAELAEEGGAMQKHVQPSEAMRQACAPLLERCDAVFSGWYQKLHGAKSITRLKRMQTFVTRYRPKPQEAGLLRHIDGAHVDGSLILALTGPDPTEGSPIDIAFEGGGVTVWERSGPDGQGPEEAYKYPMRAGDMCTLDNYIWHQGNPIHAGERWALVIFYQVRYNRQHRLANIVLNMAREMKAREAESAAGGVDADSKPESATQERSEESDAVPAGDEASAPGGSVSSKRLSPSLFFLACVFVTAAALSMVRLRGCRV